MTGLGWLSDASTLSSLISRSTISVAVNTFIESSACLDECGAHCCRRPSAQEHCTRPYEGQEDRHDSELTTAPTHRNMTAPLCHLSPGDQGLALQSKPATDLLIVLLKMNMQNS